MSSAKATGMLIALLAASPVLACLTITGQGTTGLGGTMSLDATDNGAKTCTVDYSGTGDHGNGKCQSGFSMSWKWPHVDDPIKLHYCNPQTCYDVDVKGDCSSMNCCGGNIPCSCTTCLYSGSYFGC